MARKTVEVEFIKDRVNTLLAARESTPEQREGAFGVLESVLFQTGNYRGFSYLSSELDAAGRLIFNYDNTPEVLLLMNTELMDQYVGAAMVIGGITIPFLMWVWDKFK